MFIIETSRGALAGSPGAHWSGAKYSSTLAQARADLADTFADKRATEDRATSSPTHGRRSKRAHAVRTLATFSLSTSSPRASSRRRNNMGRRKTRPPKQPADPAHVSAVRRAAALASAKARAERSINKGIRPKAVHIRAETFDNVEAAATKLGKTITETATEAIEHGLPHLFSD